MLKQHFCVVCGDLFWRLKSGHIVPVNGKFRVGTRSRTCSDACSKAYQKDFKHKKNYGVSVIEFKERLRQQKMKCPGCGRDQPGGKGWCQDHDHVTGRARGVLCQSCNFLLGRIEANPDRAQKLLAYLEEWKEDEQVQGDRDQASAQ